MAFSAKILPLRLFPSNANYSMVSDFTRPSSSIIEASMQIHFAKRTGKRRYPSEKRKLQRQTKTLTYVKNKEEGFWRMSKLNVPVDKDPGKDHLGISDGLLEAIAKVLEFPMLKEPRFVYTVDMDVKKLLDLEPRTWDFISQLEPEVGVLEHFPDEKVFGDLISIIRDHKWTGNDNQLKESGSSIHSEKSATLVLSRKPKVAVVGSGPSGLFASLVLGELGANVTLIERGEAVEQRGRDIGALVVRKILQSESNFCFGEVLGVMENW